MITDLCHPYSKTKTVTAHAAGDPGLARGECAFALVACARKLLIYANAVVQRQQKWTPQNTPV